MDEMFSSHALNAKYNREKSMKGTMEMDKVHIIFMFGSLKMTHKYWWNYGGSDGINLDWKCT